MNYYKEVESLIKQNEINKGVRALQDNSETLHTYWNIGRLIVEAQGGKKRAKYGDGNGNYHWTVMYDASTGQPIRNDDGSYFVKAIDPTQGTMTGTAQSVNVYPDGSMTNN